MKYISVEELELLSFFEVEPKRTDPDVPWPYNEYSYHVELDTYYVSFRISVAYKDVSISITHNGNEIYSFKALSVDDVRYNKDGHLETLEIVVSERDTILFRLRPTVLITQNADAT